MLAMSYKKNMDSWHFPNSAKSIKGTTFMPGNCLSLVAWTEGRCRCETITGRPRRIRALIRSSFDKWSNLSFYWLRFSRIGYLVSSGNTKLVG